MSREKQYSQIRNYTYTLNTFAVPLMIQFLANYAIGLTDQAIIGRISIEAYGVIGVINSFNYMLLGIAGAISIAFNIRAGHVLGAGNDRMFRHEFMAAILLDGLIGILLLIGTLFAKRFILERIYGFHGVPLSVGLTFFAMVSPYGLLQLLIFTLGQEILEGSVFVVAVNSIIARIGVIELSAYLILQQLLSFLFVPMNMYGSAALTLIGRNRDDREGLKMYPGTGCILSMLCYCAIASLFIIFRSAVPKIITTDTRAIEESSKLIRLAIVTNCLTPMATIYKNALTAVGESRFILYRTAAVNMAAIAIAVVSTVVLHLGLRGILLCNLFNGLCLFIIYYHRYKRAITA